MSHGTEEEMKAERDERLRRLDSLEASVPRLLPRAPVVGDECPQCQSSRTLAVFNESLVCRQCCLRLPRTDIEACAQETLPSGASGVGPDTRQYLSVRWTQVRRVIHETIPSMRESQCSLTEAELTEVMRDLQAKGINSSLYINLPDVLASIKKVCTERDPQWWRNVAIWCTAKLSSVPPPTFTQTEMVKLSIMFRRLHMVHRKVSADGRLFLRYAQCVFNLIYFLGGHDDELYVYFPPLRGLSSLRRFNAAFNRLSSVADLNWQPVDCVPLSTARRDQAKAKRHKV